MTKNQLPEPIFLSSRVVQNLTGFDLRQLRKLSDAGQFPRGVRVSAKRTIFSREAVFAWVQTVLGASRDDYEHLIRPKSDVSPLPPGE